MSKAEAGGVKVFCAHDEIVPVGRLVPNPRNPNQHPKKQIELLAHIIEHQGWRAPITVSRRSGFVVKGHGRLEAAKWGGWATVPVDYQEYESEAAEWADLIADNQIANYAEMDREGLKDMLEEIDTGDFDMLLTGFTEEDLESLLTAAPPEGDAEEDDFDAQDEYEDIEQAETRHGDLIVMGRHRLLCGDSTNEKDFARLFQDKRGQLVFTDPPYGVSYESQAQGSIMNDDLEGEALKGFLVKAFKCARKYIDGAAYVWYASRNHVPFELALVDAGWHVRQQIIWVKNQLVLGRSDYHWKHEPCLYCEGDGVTVPKIHEDGTPYATSHVPCFYCSPKDGSRYFTPDRTQTTTWEVDRDNSKEYKHPTQKPVKLAEIAVKNSSKPGDLVLDMFTGSGTTLIACEQLDRTFYGLELDPKFCDVIRKRWEKLTGKKAHVYHA